MPSKLRLQCVLCHTAVVYDPYTRSMTCSCNSVMWKSINDGEPLAKPQGGERLENVRVTKLAPLYDKNTQDNDWQMPIHQ